MNIPLTVLGVIDGFGYSPQTEGNAIYAAKTPNLDELWSHYPHYLLKAAEEEVGLAFGEIGNSEVGHITIGTGRVIPQSLSLINKSIDDGSFFENRSFLNIINQVKLNDSALHLLGIISTSGVHGHLYHYLALMKLAARLEIKNLYLHLILDGRDSGPRDAPFFLREINKILGQTKTGIYASITGRAYSMDRNNNWERTALAYNVLFGESKYTFPTPEKAIEYFYAQSLDDENIPPTTIVADGQKPITIQENDGLIITNFREDRARQITKSLCLPAFTKFERKRHPQKIYISTMTSYEKSLPVEVAFPPPPIYNTLSDVIGKSQINQIHIAETEKYAHVTYFFNGGREAKTNYEEFYLVPSLKPEQFEANPQMSAPQITEAVIQSINLGYQFIVFNFANCDMVGHTGNFQSVTKAVETIDEQFKKIWDVIQEHNGYLFITADHGNSEQMINPKTKAIYKEHTISPVPFIVLNKNLYDANAKTEKILSNTNVSGLLSDIAPSILTILGLSIPTEMTGTALIDVGSNQSPSF